MPKRTSRESLAPQPMQAAEGSLHPFASGPSRTAVIEPPSPADAPAPPRRRSRPTRTAEAPHSFHAASTQEDHGANHQAELFYLQKQIQQQTQMIFIMEDGARIQGIIEWYDRHSIKVRGKSRILIYKSAVKYLYKAGELGNSGGE